ncbi:uncharacterized protein HMPREF1541_01192 [Cyphellophora europaea CBS 101466]|uniref:RWD domain-containing protein n=1 Tax=Cyphellophora europaea (strain CBS 101466) TaxID=1220924 RepID=W2SE89_CYPE1|nr:uncharacterized protein HMPREF1541_01192 [Cyphellophora europaea CBS 101466]ETN47002.1 hypothetical protein HMPREF1541_01192 [Cyphellophora europaea CBS 101466]
MSPPISERLTLEIELLSSMYPEGVAFDPVARDLAFSTAAGSKDRLILRLPEGYPVSGWPEVILATDQRGGDTRQRVKSLVKDICGEATPGGEAEDSPGEVLDAILDRFVGLLEASIGERDDDESLATPDVVSDRPKTIIIWLHHLLATSKRKLALHPTHDGLVGGITKPGYPGIMLFSGSQEAVGAHVAELKSLNWQAFAVRYEADEAWNLGNKIKEVETIAEAVQCIEEERREAFLKAVGVK